MKEVVVIRNIKEVYPMEYNSCESRSGFRLGEVVYDQHGMIGMIMAFYEGGQVRLDSNGCCSEMELRKCPVDKAEKEIKRLNEFYRREYLEKSYDFLNKHFEIEVVEEFKEEDRIVLNSKEFATFQRDCLFYGKYEGCKKLKEYIRTSLTYLRFSFPQWRLLYSVLWMTEEGYLFNQN